MPISRCLRAVGLVRLVSTEVVPVWLSCLAIRRVRMRHWGLLDAAAALFMPMFCAVSVLSYCAVIEILTSLCRMPARMLLNSSCDMGCHPPVYHAHARESGCFVGCRFWTHLW
ncbi:hypothetical protein C8Q79DRAFT_993865 [Trametes meyenii]|nr:hypothetical protein C8Q79DRAFT_993865 [Trametes meyenii]